MPDEDQDSHEGKGEGEPIVEPGRGGRAHFKVKREFPLLSGVSKACLHVPDARRREIDPGFEHSWMRAALRSRLGDEELTVTVLLSVMSLARGSESQIDFCHRRARELSRGLKREAQQHPADSKWRRGSQNGDPVLSYFASGYESAKVSVCRLEPGSTDQREPEEKESDHDLPAGLELHITIPRISMG